MNFVEKFIESILKLPETRGLSLITDSVYEKRFSNQKAIICLPASPATIRSFAGDVFLDEFALYKDDRKIYEAMYPSITRGFDIELNSTPLGQNNLFYEIYSNENKYKDYKRYSIDIFEAVKQGLKVDIEQLKRNYDEESFSQEFMCEFIDEKTSFFPYELLRKCIDDYENVKGSKYLGIDIGRTNDNTSIVETTDSNGIFYLTKLETMKNASFDKQKFTIKQMYQDGVNAALIDKGAIGYQLSEELEKELTNCRGVFTNQQEFMNDAVSFVKKLMEQGKFKISEDRRLINSFHKIQKVITENNRVTFKIKRDSDGHGDEAIATILSLYAGKSPSAPRARWV